MRSSRSIIDCCRTILSLPAQARTFLPDLPASTWLFEIALLLIGPVEERICGLSIPAVTGWHRPGRTANLWLRFIESMAVRLFTEDIGSGSPPAAVGLGLQSRSFSVCSPDQTPAVWMCEKENVILPPSSAAQLGTGLATYCL